MRGPVSKQSTFCLLVVAAISIASVVAQRPKAELIVQTGHASSVRSVAFSPDGKLIASLGLDNAIKLWDAASGKEIRAIGGSEASASVAFSPDGRSLATVSFKTRSVMLFSVATGELIRRFPPVEDVLIWDMRFSPAGDRIATIGYYNRVRIYDALTGSEIKTRHLGGRFGAFVILAFSPDGRYIAAPDARGVTIFAVDGDDGFVLPAGAEGTRSLAFSPDGKFLAIGESSGQIRIFDIAGRLLARTLSPRVSAAVVSLAYAADGRTLAGGSADGTVTLWDLTEAFPTPKTISAHAKGVYTLAFRPDGRSLASGGDDDTIRLWETTTQKLIGTLAPIASLIFSVEFSPDGRILAIARENRTVQLWSAESGNELRTLTGHAGLIYRTEFSPDGKLLASASADRTIRLWDVETGAMVREIHGHTGEVRRLAFSPDGTTLASGDSNGWIILWDVRSGQRREIPVAADSQEINALRFSPDGTMLASGGWRGLKLWDVATLNLIREAGPAYSMVSAIAFSSDGKTVAMNGNKYYDKVPEGSTYAEEGNRIRVLDVASLAELNSYPADADYRIRFEAEFPLGFDDFFYESASPVMIAKVAFGNRVQIFHRGDRKELATLVTTDGGRWTVVAPDGRFDTNNSLDEINGLHWIDPADPFAPIPLEILMRQYYEPGLYPRLGRCRSNSTCDSEFRSLPSITEIDRVQPRIGEPRISAVKTDGTVDVSVDVESGGRGGLLSGVFDLRLFVDRRLAASSVPRAEVENYIRESRVSASDVGAWRQTHDLGRYAKFVDGKATFVFRGIRLPRDGRNRIEFSAYAFNGDRVKSETARTHFEIAGPVTLRGRTVLVSIGVNASESSRYRLDFAANDARQMQEVLGGRLAASGHDLVRVDLVSDHDGRGRLTRNLATKKIIRGVFDVLSGRRDDVDPATLQTIDGLGKLTPVRPEDTLIITFSGHGYTRAGVFYMLPYDIGEHTGAITEDILPRLISSDELSLWMRDIVAKETLFVIDACHSAASVQGAEFKPGPMGSRGLGQLAYDKGMRVLAAAQTNNVALELRSLRHGLLSYALLQDGIVRGLADSDPRDSELTASEWLSYAVKGVPALYKNVVAGKAKLAIGGEEVDLSKLNEKEKAETFCQGGNCKSKASVQQPVLFDFARNDRSVPLFKLAPDAPRSISR